MEQSDHKMSIEQSEISDYEQTIDQSYYDCSLIDKEIDEKIINETNEQIGEINNDLITISEIWTTLSHMIKSQGDTLNIANNNVEMTDISISDTVIHLTKAKEYHSFPYLIRDIALVVGGGVLGTVGFLLGPFVGVGTVIAGAAGGGAAVAGIHKLS